MEIVRARGVDVAYRRSGAGAPLVLVHGAGEDSRIWGSQFDGLSAELTVAAWDEPGAGRSADLPAGFGLSDFADCLASVVDALALGSAHVAGLSWGGTVALELYRRHPDRVASLIMVDTYAGWRGSLPEAEVRARIEGARRMLAAPPDRFDPTFPGLFAGEPPARFVPLLEEIAAGVRPASMATVLEIMAEADLRDVLPAIAVPTLLVWGERDVRSPVETVARQFERSIPGAELVVLAGAGHLSHLERPDEFNDVVREWCSARPGADPAP